MDDKNSIVYLYGYSLAKRDEFKSLFKILNEQINQETLIEFILIHDGVVRTTNKGINPKFLKKLLELPIIVYAMIPDIKARGMDPENLNNKIKGIGYSELVDILVNTQKIVSWL
ncbi:MAG: DsrH/TusB family sulfur metabolism protein [Candidatus Hermodarchaeota archaeon]